MTLYSVLPVIGTDKDAISLIYFHPHIIGAEEHISVNNKGYSIDQIIDGETVAEVLDYVQFEPKKMVRTLETWVKRSIEEGRITTDEGKEFLSTYRSGLYGYTYLE